MSRRIPREWMNFQRIDYPDSITFEHIIYTKNLLSSSQMMFHLQ